MNVTPSINPQFGARAFIKLPEDLAESLKGANYKNLRNGGSREYKVLDNGDLFIHDGYGIDEGSPGRLSWAISHARDIVSSTGKKDGDLISQLKEVIRNAFESRDGIFYADRHPGYIDIDSL